MITVNITGWERFEESFSWLRENMRREWSPIMIIEHNDEDTFTYEFSNDVMATEFMLRFVSE